MTFLTAGLVRMMPPAGATQGGQADPNCGQPQGSGVREDLDCAPTGPDTVDNDCGKPRDEGSGRHQDNACAPGRVDNDCGKWNAPSVSTHEDNDCTTAGQDGDCGNLKEDGTPDAHHQDNDCTTGAGSERDADCSLPTAEGDNKHQDNDCSLGAADLDCGLIKGTSGAEETAFAHSDGGCWFQSGPDEDCGFRTEAGHGHADWDCAASQWSDSGCGVASSTGAYADGDCTQTGLDSACGRPENNDDLDCPPSLSDFTGAGLDPIDPTVPVV